MEVLLEPIAFGSFFALFFCVIIILQGANSLFGFIAFIPLIIGLSVSFGVAIQETSDEFAESNVLQDPKQFTSLGVKGETK